LVHFKDPQVNIPVSGKTKTKTKTKTNENENETCALYKLVCQKMMTLLKALN